MPTEVIMPALGIAMETGHLIAWLKQEGDSIQRGEILMEIETDKTTVEVEASASGILANVTAKAGEDVPVGEVIALILAPGEVAPSLKKGDATVNQTIPSVSPNTSTPKSATPVAIRMAEAHGIDVSQIQTTNKKITRADVEAFVGNSQVNTTDRILASPKARRLAHEQSIDLSLVKGSGPDGAVLANDVITYDSARETVSMHVVSPTPEIRETIELKTETGNMWRRMAQRLTESWQTIPHFYLKRDVNAEALIEWRNSLKSRSNAKITYTDLLIKVVAGALRKHPHANGQWNGVGVIFNDEINIGLAVAVDEGLLVPVIHNADQLGITAIAEQRQTLVERAQSGKLQPIDLQGGTFTISNLGMFGIDEFSAIVNPPQAAILAVGSISDRIVPVDGQVVVRPMMTLSLSCDHRAIDGARGAQFLDSVVTSITNPLALLD